MDGVASRQEKESRAIIYVATGPEFSNIAKKNTGGEIPESKADDLKTQPSNKPRNYRRAISRARYFSRPGNGNDISPSQSDHPQSKSSIERQGPRKPPSSIREGI